MKNLAIAIGVLIVVIVFAFVFVKGNSKKDDTLIPSPVPISSPQLEFFKRQGSQSAMNQQAPFELLKPEQIEGKKVKITTAKGNIVFSLYGDAPIAASNFISLVGRGFYNGLTFHRREEGFVIQGGDPRGNGTGGPGYQFIDEKVTRDYKRGIVAMANSGPNTNGSQFFIMLADAPLPKNYTIFGNVIEGMDVVDKIAVGDKMTTVVVE
ncbi:MAG TPA: peptidylprolyl isomerase [Candidatus Saccharimonadales bacterium]|nr:peptidylprolyl isomerase [Candidatus Saccharimonadales bacterium]